MTCNTFHELKGRKSEKIKQLLNRKLQEQKELELKQKAKDGIFDNVILCVKEAQEKLGVAKSKRDALLRKHNAECDSWGAECTKVHGTKLSLKKDCFVPDSVHEKLQKADDLFALGKTKEAQAIWNSVIEKYELLE